MSRFYLVLGGGGVLGGAWLVGALAALREVHGVEPRDAERIVGTSAGSVVAALLGAGVSVEELQAHQLGCPPATGPLAALLPEGRGSLHAVGRLVHDVQLAVGAAADGWSPHPGTRVVAMDYGSGHRVAFGAEGAPRPALADAVMASCAIPGWFPVVLEGVRYVDGGACSSTNVDLLADAGLDEVYVLAPMVSFTVDAPPHRRTRMERAWRERVTRRCLREVGKVHARGTEVTVLGPGREDLEAIGGNLMTVERRRHVLETSLRTSAAALRDPEPIGTSGSTAGVDLVERDAD